jgi:hypothetical protein
MRGPFKNDLHEGPGRWGPERGRNRARFARESEPAHRTRPLTERQLPWTGFGGLQCAPRDSAGNRIPAPSLTRVVASPRADDTVSLRKRGRQRWAAERECVPRSDSRSRQYSGRVRSRQGRPRRPQGVLAVRPRQPCALYRAATGRGLPGAISPPHLSRRRRQVLLQEAHFRRSHEGLARRRRVPDPCPAYSPSFLCPTPGRSTRARRFGGVHRSRSLGRAPGWYTWAGICTSGPGSEP